MDKLDQILSKKSDSDVPDGLADRIRLNFRRKYQSRQRWLVLSAVFLILAGFCVVFPELAAVNQQLNLPPGDVSPLPGIDIPISQGSAEGFWQGLMDIQDTIITTFSLPAWLGLFSVGIGSVIGIGGIIPRLHTR